MLPKFDPMLEPASLSRHTAVRSMNPIGTMQMLPSRRNAGTALVSGAASHGLLEEEAGAAGACGRGAGRLAGSVAARGTTAVVLATWPSCGKALTGASFVGVAAGIAAGAGALVEAACGWPSCRRSSLICCC